MAFKQALEAYLKKCRVLSEHETMFEEKQIKDIKRHRGRKK
jgi:hypothetical protein